ncbi:glycosyltransferase family 2 protein [Solimonas soli]|uniref:glycosyltransferase family 2 protein n=1 Tax=Solimonas soli TaxID=413479 RepID=UPI000484DA0F|nr:glycosyltransferase family A protein [Solimonas soli]
MPAYDVVIPAFNAERTIVAALRSVAAQSPAPQRIIVVDDGSSDGTVDAVRRSGIDVLLLTQPNAGPGSATSHGFAASRAALIATLDADDVWLPDKMRRQMALMAAEPGIAISFTHWRHFRDADPATAGPAGPGWTRSTMLARAEAIAAIGPVVDPPGRRGEMVDWLGRARAQGHRLQMMEEVLVLRRIHAGSLSYGRDAARDRGYLEVARRALLRQRAARAARDTEDGA